MRWQQKLRIGIAVFGVGFVILLFYAVRSPKPRDQAPGRVERIDPAAAAESTKGEIRRLGAEGQPWWAEFEHHLVYPDGRQKLTGVTVHVDRRAGRNFIVKANEADVGTGQDSVQMRGAVQLTASDGLVAKTEAASYSQREGMVRAPGATSFTRARVSGHSVGMTYDEARDVLWMLDQAVIRMAPDGAEGAAVDITAGAAGFARADHYVRYERGFRLVTGPRTLTSALATAYLNDDESKVETLEMRGSSRVTGAGESAGALREMAADDINLEFADDGRTLRGATLSSVRPRRATLDLGAPGAGERKVSGQWIDVRFSEDGATVSSLVVRESVELLLPATPAEPARTITAATLTARGTDGQALNAARFLDGVEYREIRPAAAPRVVRARALDLQTAPGLGAIDTAHFTGAVRFEEDQTRAAAGEARYRVSRGVVELEGIDDTTGLIPRVADGQVTIDGRQIEMALEARTIRARQDVRSVMVAATDSRAERAGAKPRRAGMLKDDQPVYATALELNYDSASRLAVYTSAAPAQARLWQGDTTIMGDTITVDDATGNLTAKGKVASTLMLEQRNEKSKQLERVPSVATAADMVYEDALRRATYTGNAHVAGPQGDLRAARVELYLKEGGSELAKVEGYTSVTMRDAARTATGDRLTFFSEEGRYVMVGAPVSIVAECRETTGRTLTFFKSTNNINVDPTDELRTQTRPVPGCVAPDKR